ncbi:MAG TPA: type II 3-dehydroquinate dehydratase [Solirubrobacteraceae bacterium]|jgi:3-dehydroquinate dehydratase-2|nr:type II 3-dehydroquinate dehydratase [Solirubrobacteraceae bacterium]
MSEPSWRVEVMHGVNLDQLGRRDPALYGTLTLGELEQRVAREAQALGITASFFQTNYEGAFVEHLHGLQGSCDAVLLNPGAWSHYAWAIRDALEIAALPAVEVHLSDVANREPWRRTSVIGELCFATVSGEGPEGYGRALRLVRERLESPAAGVGGAGGPS